MLKMFSPKRKGKMQNPAVLKTTEPKENISEEITDEKIAAAIMALHFHFEELNYVESEVITIIQPLSVRYSPWSQKHLAMKKIQRIR